MSTKELQRGDACPRCGDSFKAAPVPTDAQYAKAFDRELNPGLPEGMDTASPDQRAELGALHRCMQCGYCTRFLPDASAAKATVGN